MIDNDNVKFTIWTHFILRKTSFLKIAMQAPSVLYTWILGKMFVGVSVLYRFFTISTNILSRANVVGRKVCPFG